MTCPNCMTLSCYICRQIITGYDHFNEVRHIFSFQPLLSIIRTQSRSGQPPQPGQVGKCLLWDKVEERHDKEACASTILLSCAQRCFQVEEAQKKAIAEYRKEHPGVGEDWLAVEFPKATGEPSDLGSQRRRPRRPPPYERIEPLHPAPDREFDRYRQLFGNIRHERARNPEPRPPQPQVVEGGLVTRWRKTVADPGEGAAL